MNQFQFRTDLTSVSSSDCESLSQAELLSMADAECLRLWGEVRLGYGGPEGDPRLAAELISQLYPGRQADSELALMGPQEALFSVATVICDLLRNEKPDERPEAAVTWPAFQGLHETLRACGANVHRWEAEPPSSTHCDWRFCLDRLRNLLDERPGIRLLVTNFPHNPTGYCPTPEQWLALIQLCRERQLLLVSDEIYSGIGPARIVPACQLYESAVTLNGLSKCYGLPGLRFGWLVTRDARILAGVRNLRNFVSVCLAPPVEVLSLIALRNLSILAARAESIVKDNAAKAEKFFQEFDHLFAYRAPAAGSLALVQLRQPVLDRWPTGRDFCDSLVSECGVFAVSGRELLYSDNFLRLGLGRRNLGDSLNKWANYLRTLHF